jgi:hypothetical protein
MWLRFTLGLGPQVPAFAVRKYRSKRDADRNSGAARIPAVVQVIPVIDVIDVNIVGLVPVGSPVFRIGIIEIEPIAVVLEAWIPAHHHEGEAVYAEPVSWAIVGVKNVVRYPVAVVAPALPPGAMLGFEAPRAMLLPGTVLFLLPDALLLRRAP